jgi:hypothetical protein
VTVQVVYEGPSPILIVPGVGEIERGVPFECDEEIAKGICQEGRGFRQVDAAAKGRRKTEE